MKAYHFLMIMCFTVSIMIGTYRYIERDYNAACAGVIISAFLLLMLIFIIRSDHKSEDLRLEWKREMEKLKEERK